jgi:hypothetical protein
MKITSVTATHYNIRLPKLLTDGTHWEMRHYVGHGVEFDWDRREANQADR